MTLRVLVFVPKEPSEMGSSILFRVSVSSDRTASAVFRDEYSRKLFWHHFSGLKSGINSYLKSNYINKTNDDEII